MWTVGVLIRGIARWLVWFCELRYVIEGTSDRLISMGALGTLSIVYMHLTSRAPSNDYE